MKVIGAAGIVTLLIAGGAVFHQQEYTPEHSAAEYQSMIEASVRSVEEADARKAQQLEEQNIPAPQPTVQSMKIFLKDHAIQPVPKIEDLPPCGMEDSDDCFWDAQSRGNGRGQSFYIIDGIKTFVGPCIRCPR